MQTITHKTISDRFVFSYQPGEESKVLDALIELVGRKDLSFTWFDAAIVSHEIGQRLKKELVPFLPKKNFGI